MGKAEGEERKEIVKDHARWRNKVKQIQKKRRWEKELRLNFEIGKVKMRESIGGASRSWRGCSTETARGDEDG